MKLRISRKFLLKMDSIKLFLIYLNVIYPLIFQLYVESEFISITNQLILGLLFVWVLQQYNSSFKKFNNSRNIEAFFYLSISYQVISMTLFLTSLNLSFLDASREILYAILPISFFFIGKSGLLQTKSIYYLFLGTVGLVILIGILNRIDNSLIPSTIKEAIEAKRTINFASYYTPIIMGYLSQLIFAILLFKKIKIPFMHNLAVIISLLIAIITLQRAAFLGLLLSIFFYAISTKRFLRLGTVLIIGIMLFQVSQFFLDDTGITSTEKLFEEVNDFNLAKVNATRIGQAVITNNENILLIVFGEGFGKYSPNNMNSILKMPDASYYRIFNELGILGTIIFFIPFIIILFKLIKTKHHFGIYFISFSLISFFFNRTIWSIPINFNFYLILGILYYEYDNQRIKTSTKNRIEDTQGLSQIL